MTELVMIMISMLFGIWLGGRLEKAKNNIDRILHYEVQLDNGNICHECGQAFPCPTLVETRS